MLSVFAIDPEICRDLEWFRYCTEHCHPSQGRVIADLPPREWYRKAEAIIKELAQDLDTLKKRSLIARLQSLSSKETSQLVERPGTSWNYLETEWITNTEQEHKRENFSAIVSPKYKEADDNRYHPDELNRTVTAWNTPSGIAITRSPRDFVKAILPMLRLAVNIHFIDRYFNVDSDSLFTGNYQQIIGHLTKHRNTPEYPFPSLTIHCCPDVPEKITNDNLKQHYASLIPKGESVQVFVWQIQKNIEIKKGNHPFHNRYVLSNHCGVIAGYGTDSYKEETDAPDVLQVIDHEIYLKLWNQIRDEEFPMIHIEERNKFVIDGAKST